MRGLRSFNCLPRRCYAAARRSQDLTVPLAGHKTVAPFPPQNVQVSKLPNGLVVASLENYSPLSRVGVFVKAGSRYETAENQGVSHVLRLAANLTTKGASAFKICRGVEALGGSLTVTSTRETMVYTVDCLREHLDSLMEYLGDVSTAQEFRPWEVSELVSRVKIDKAVAQQCPQTGVFEKLHEAAYKNALSNSLYCPDHMVGHISTNQLQSFVEDNFISGRMALVGIGVKHSVLRQVGEGLLSVRSGAATPADKAVYRGGELRVHTNDDLVHALIASEGAANGSAQANAFSVLQRILGSGPRVKRGSNITSKLCQGVAKATADPFDATAFSLSYSDSGLFGIYTVTQAGSAREVINAAVAQVRGVAEGNVSEADVTAAKNQVKTEYLMLMENSEVMLEEVGAQALAAAAYQQPDAVLQAVDAVTLDNVVKAAKTFVDGKKTMAALGHHTNTPFVDEI
ncbi:cytochrome b-c1 complex subunit 2, mitochondrial [Takifugu flavidus]|uniref:Cytochrome b-c1 complex subunit 2, mitochondrial n=2 Tax=Takifugu TaxID=31032 RepID=A0A5C6NSM8_9TELE|nr:cytochrome b-c1 complex subunit 2, mitochondrial [Takifugu flavidus]TWW69975.1 Cytochrome b-c1 complex subunit 2, mitochondrial [Takifugu flavidus]